MPDVPPPPPPSAAPPAARPGLRQPTPVETALMEVKKVIVGQDTDGTVTPNEYQDIVSDRILRTRRIQSMRPRASAALVNAQHELAFRKRRLKEAGQDLDRDPLIARWRGEIERLRRTPF